MIATAFHIDPTRTSLQRRSFVADMTKRFGAVQQAVWNLIANDRVIVNAGLDEVPEDFKKEPSGDTTIHDRNGEVYKVQHFLSGKTHLYQTYKGGESMGYALVYPGRKSVADVAIAKDHQKKGIGTALYKHIEAHLGHKLEPDKVQTPAGKALWASRTRPPTTNAFDFATDPDKIDHFQKWLQRQINLHILETRTATGNPSLKRPWLASRIINAYKIGLARAYTDVKRAGGSPPSAGLNLASEMKRAMDSAYEAGKLQRHLEAGMAVSTRKVELIYTRAYHDLQGITQDMSTKLSRILATGMINGDSPHSMARKMVQQISGISLRRARLIATTELTAAHASGTLDGLDMQGVRRVMAQVEFKTAGDERVCPKCKHLEGKRFTIDQARGVIPVHPSCRCSWSPT